MFAGLPGERQYDEAEGEVAAAREQGGGVAVHQEGGDEDEPPHQAGQQGKQDSEQHVSYPVKKKEASLAGGKGGVLNQIAL